VFVLEIQSDAELNLTIHCMHYVHSCLYTALAYVNLSSAIFVCYMYIYIYITVVRSKMLITIGLYAYYSHPLVCCIRPPIAFCSVNYVVKDSIIVH